MRPLVASGLLLAVFLLGGVTGYYIRGNEKTPAVFTEVTKQPDPPSQEIERNPAPSQSPLEKPARSSGMTQAERASRWQAVLATPYGNARVNALHSFFIQYAQDDPMEAARFAEANTEGDLRKRALSRIMEVWLKRDVDAALDYLAGVEDVTLRGYIASECSDELSDLDPVKGFHWAKEHAEGRYQGDVMKRMFARLGYTDPQKGVELLNELPYGSTYTRSLESLSYIWARHDPYAAIEWIFSLPVGPERERAYSSYANCFAYERPDEALDYATRFSEGEEKEILTTKALARKADQAPDGALRWAEGQDSDAVRNKAIVTVLTAWSDDNASRALNYLAKNSDLQLEPRDCATLARKLSYSDPASVAEWCLTLNGQAQVYAVEATAQEWLAQDSYKASEWIAKIPPGPAQDEALTRLVYDISRTEPGDAFDWAQSASDPKVRSSLLQRSVSYWKKSDPSTAWHTIQTCSLPAEEKAQLLALLEDK